MFEETLERISCRVIWGGSRGQEGKGRYEQREDGDGAGAGPCVILYMMASTESPILRAGGR